MLRRLLWIVISSVALIAARKAAERVFRIVAGEEPPGKR
jgi:hypothetical protein